MKLMRHREATAAGIGLGTTSRRRKPTAETFVDNTAKLRLSTGIGPGTTAMYMQRTTSGAAGNGLYTTIKYMHGASGINMGTAIKHLHAQRAAPRETAWAQR